MKFEIPKINIINENVEDQFEILLNNILAAEEVFDSYFKLAY